MKKSTALFGAALAVAIAVAMIVLGVGIPNFAALVRSNSTVAEVNNLVTAIHLARSEAVGRGVEVVDYLLDHGVADHGRLAVPRRLRAMVLAWHRDIGSLHNCTLPRNAKDRAAQARAIRFESCGIERQSSGAEHRQSDGPPIESGFGRPIPVPIPLTEG